MRFPIAALLGLLKSGVFIKSIQSFIVTPTTAGVTATITAVNTARALVIPVGYTQTYGTESGGYGCTMVLTNATTVTCTNVTNNGTSVAKGVVLELF